MNIFTFKYNRLKVQFTLAASNDTKFLPIILLIHLSQTRGAYYKHNRITEEYKNG